MIRKMKVIFSAVLAVCAISAAGFCAEEKEALVYPDTLNFGHEGTEKPLYLTNPNSNSDLFWSIKPGSLPAWLKVEPAQGKIDNPSRIPADAPYQFSNMWPKLPQPWYFRSFLWDVGIDHEGSIYVVIYSVRGRVMKFNKYGEFLFEIGSDDQTDKNYLKEPTHITFDSQNNFYVSTNSKVKKFDQKGTFIMDLKMKIDGLERTSYSPGAIAVDSKDNLYVTNHDYPSSSYEYCIQKFDKTGTFVKTWGREGMGDGEFAPSYNKYFGIVIDSKDYVYVADNHFRRIQKFDSEGNFIKKWAALEGGVVADWPLKEKETDWQLGGVFTIDKNDIIYVGHEHSGFMHKFTTEGEYIPYNWSGRPDSLDYCGDAAIDAEGNIYLCMSATLIKYDSTGKKLSEWKSWGNEDGKFNSIEGIAVDKKGNVYVSDIKGIQIFDPKGNFISKWNKNDPKYSQELYLYMWTSAMAVDAQNNIYTADSDTIVKFDIQGNPISKFKIEESEHIYDIAIDAQNNIYAVVANKDNFLFKLDPAGNILQKWVRNRDELKITIGPITYYNLHFHDLVIDFNNNVYISAAEGGVFKFDSNGNLLTSWKYAPHKNISCSVYENYIDLAIDGKNNLYVVFSAYNEVQKYDSNGNLLVTFGKEGFNEGEFNNAPRAIAVDSQDTIYIAEVESNRIQVFSQAAQQIKATVDRSKLDAETNSSKLDFFNDAAQALPPVSVPVTALTEAPADTTPPVIGQITADFYKTMPGGILLYKLNLSAITDAGSGMGEGAQVGFSYTNHGPWYNTRYTPEIILLFAGGPQQIIWLKFKDAAGNWTESVSLNITPPATKLSYAPSYTPGTWSKQPLKITLSAEDRGSGVKETRYSVDGREPAVKYTLPFTVNKQGISTIKYYSVGNALTKEELKSAEIKIDTATPEIRPLVPLLRVPSSKIAVVSFVITDSASGVKSAALVWYARQFRGLKAEWVRKGIVPLKAAGGNMYKGVVIPGSVPKGTLIKYQALAVDAAGNAALSKEGYVYTN
ncbi:MAG: NHL repeat-containing protein [Candidatus Omnitrophota bacterium]